MFLQNETLEKLYQDESNKHQQQIREKQSFLRTKLNDLNSELRAEKQKLFRVEMDKMQSKDSMEELRRELDEIKASEKKLRAELDREKLNCQQILQELSKAQHTIETGGIGSKQIANAKPLGFSNYIARQKQAGVITGKVGMQSKFMDFSKLNEKQQNPLTASQRRGSTLGSQLNPLNFSGKASTPRSSIRLTNSNIDQMLSAALGASDPAEPIVEEDTEPDHTADAHDILDEMLKDSSSDEGN